MDVAISFVSYLLIKLISDLDGVIAHLTEGRACFYPFVYVRKIVSLQGHYRLELSVLEVECAHFRARPFDIGAIHDALAQGFISLLELLRLFDLNVVSETSLQSGDQLLSVFVDDEDPASVRFLDDMKCHFICRRQFLLRFLWRSFG